MAVALSSSDPAMLNHPNNPCDVIVVSYWQRTFLCLNLYIKIFPVMLQTKVTLVPLFICDLSLYKNYKTKRQHQHTHKYYFKKHIKLDKRYINMCILFFLYRFRRDIWTNIDINIVETWGYRTELGHISIHTVPLVHENYKNYFELLKTTDFNI